MQYKMNTKPKKLFINSFHANYLKKPSVNIKDLYIQHILSSINQDHNSNNTTSTLLMKKSHSHMHLPIDQINKTSSTVTSRTHVIFNSTKHSTYKLFDSPQKDHLAYDRLSTGIMRTNRSSSTSNIQNDNRSPTPVKQYFLKRSFLEKKAKLINQVIDIKKKCNISSWNKVLGTVNDGYSWILNSNKKKNKGLNAYKIYKYDLQQMTRKFCPERQAVYSAKE